jgi:hypothetical protein
MTQPAAADPFALNTAASVHIEQVGAGCPVLVIDDFYVDPHAVRALALGGNYDSSLAYYPGVHARIDDALIQPLFEHIATLLRQLGHTQVRAEALFSDFSIVTTPARQMLAKQKHPHIDGLPLAGVVYLSPDLEVGTAFFEHRPLGLAMLRNADELERYDAWLQQQGQSTQPDTYAVEDGTVWVKLHAVAGRFNRMVMYPGNAFHSIDMRDVPASQTLASARLTQRLFLGALN